MRRRHTHRSLLHSALTALLLLAMLAGQWSGLEHRVRHAGLEAVEVHQTLLADGTGDDGVSHSCTLFDAATLGVGIHSGILASSCDRTARDWTAPWPPLSWLAPVTRHFSSRAPPFN